MLVRRRLVSASKTFVLVGLAVALARSPDRKVVAQVESTPTQRVIYGVRDIVFAARGERAALIRGNISADARFRSGPYYDGEYHGADSSDQVEVWETESGKLLRTFSDFGGGLIDARLSPDGRLLATMSWEVKANQPNRRVSPRADDTKGLVKLWEVSTGELRWSKTAFERGILTAAFSPDGRHLAVLGAEWTSPGNLKVLDVQTGAILCKAGYRDPAGGVAFSPDGSRLAVRIAHDHSSEMKLYDFPALKERLTISEPKDINSMPESWDITYGFGDTVFALQMRVRERRNIAFSPDGSHLAVSLSGARKKELIHQILCFDAQTGKLEQTITAHREPVSRDKPVRQELPGGVFTVTTTPSEAAMRNRQAVTELVYLSDSRSIAALNRGVVMAVFDSQTGQALSSGRSTEPATAAAFSPDGRLLAFAARDGGVRLWDRASGELRQSFGATVDAGSRRLNVERFLVTAEAVVALAFSPDGLILASLTDNHTLNLWDVRAASLQAKLESRDSSFTCLAFSPDAKRLAVGEQIGRLTLLDPVSAEPLRETLDAQSPVAALAFSPDGKRLAAAGEDGSVRILDAATGKLEANIAASHGTMTSVGFSPDGKLLATAGTEGDVKLWDARTGVELRAISGCGAGINAAAFSPDGRFLAAACGDRTVRLWEVDSGRLVKSLEGHSAPVSSVGFLPGGTMLASGSSDGTVRLWSVPEGKSLRTLKGHEAAVNAVAFSPNGATLAAASGNNSIVFWDPRTGELKRTLKDVATIPARKSERGQPH